MAYHGTTLGALAVTGIPAYKEPFGTLMPGVFHVPNTLGESIPEGGSAADLPSVQAIRELIEREGAETIAALFAEPVQNSRGARRPATGRNCAPSATSTASCWSPTKSSPVSDAWASGSAASSSTWSRT